MKQPRFAIVLLALSLLFLPLLLATACSTKPNNKPVATDDEAHTRVGEAVVIDVLANDHDPDRDALTVQRVSTAPSNGSVTINADSSITYTPDRGFWGTDGLRYEVSDGTDTASASVALEIDAVSGTWSTTYGTMRLEQSGSSVTGSYDTQDGTLIDATLVGNVLTSVWVEPDSLESCATLVEGYDHWGKLEFVFNEEFTRFEGRWEYCDTEPLDRNWDGTWVVE